MLNGYLEFPLNKIWSVRPFLRPMQFYFFYGNVKDSHDLGSDNNSSLYKSLSSSIPQVPSASQNDHGDLFFLWQREGPP